MTWQIPSVHIEEGDVLRIVLYTPKLKGLSFKDIELAGVIDTMEYKWYLLTPITDIKHVRQVEWELKIEADAKWFQDEIAQNALKFGSSKFKN